MYIYQIRVIYMKLNIRNVKVTFVEELNSVAR